MIKNKDSKGKWTKGNNAGKAENKNGESILVCSTCYKKDKCKNYLDNSVCANKRELKVLKSRNIEEVLELLQTKTELLYFKLQKENDKTKALYYNSQFFKYSYLYQNIITRHSPLLVQEMLLEQKNNTRVKSISNNPKFKHNQIIPTASANGTGVLSQLFGKEINRI